MKRRTQHDHLGKIGRIIADSGEHVPVDNSKMDKDLTLDEAIEEEVKKRFPAIHKQLGIDHPNMKSKQEFVNHLKRDHPSVHREVYSADSVIEAARRDRTAKKKERGNVDPNEGRNRRPGGDSSDLDEVVAAKRERISNYYRGGREA